ncbi:MAG: hypothetical protein EXQ67_07995 [Thermoleophilia bacterium]|nr:hypothetical protein [Thermoleophilia bacterium]
MRALVATLVAFVVLGGSAIAVAQRADTSAATRARMIAALTNEAAAGDCNCTAYTRAKERLANRQSVDGSAEE